MALMACRVGLTWNLMFGHPPRDYSKVVIQVLVPAARPSFNIQKECEYDVCRESMRLSRSTAFWPLQYVPIIRLTCDNDLGKNEGGSRVEIFPRRLHMPVSFERWQRKTVSLSSSGKTLEDKEQQSPFSMSFMQI